MSTNYQEAVEIAVGMFKNMSGQKNGQRPFDPKLDAKVRAGAFGMSALARRPEELLKSAADNCDSYDMLRFGLANTLILDPDYDPPKAVRLWLSEYLQGNVKRPKGGTGRYSSQGLHVSIWVVIRHLEKLGFVATRNDTSPATSACDVVADALDQLDLEPREYFSVKKIWFAQKKRAKRV
jgi:hypothetical protein